jgi:transposase-like protein
MLVMIGVRADGRKELVALTDGFRESHESWADLLRDCRRRGMRAPILAVGDGAVGFWKALRDVFPQTKESGVGSTSRRMPLLRFRSRHIRARWRR